jgi:hypothetical protein
LENSVDADSYGCTEQQGDVEQQQRDQGWQQARA